VLQILSLILLGIIFLLWKPYRHLTTKFGAPFVPMETKVVERIMKLAGPLRGKTFYDLGSGDGRLVIAAALRGAQAYGVEIDPLRAYYSQLWIKLLWLSRQAKIIPENFFEVDLSNADVVTLFLLQPTNQLLKDKLFHQLKPGAKIISYGFTLEGWPPSKIHPNEGGIFGPIFVYTC